MEPILPNSFCERFLPQRQMKSTDLNFTPLCLAMAPDEIVAGLSRALFRRGGIEVPVVPPTSDCSSQGMAPLKHARVPMTTQSTPA